MNFIDRLLSNPKKLLLVLTAICLLAFLVTIPLPRVDGQLIGSDGIGYYVYLPAVLLNGTLDFTDAYSRIYAQYPQTLKKTLDKRTAKGLPSNQWPIGPAILWAPFFLLAHVLVLIANLFGAGMSSEGYSYFYQAASLSGSIFYSGAAILLTFGFVKQFTDQKPALVAVILVVFGGTLVYYMTAEPYMSHGGSAFASGLLGYGTGFASTADKAKAIALRNCQKHAPLGTIKFCAANCRTR